MSIYSLIVISLVLMFFVYDTFKEEDRKQRIGALITTLLFLPVWIYLINN